QFLLLLLRGAARAGQEPQPSLKPGPGSTGGTGRRGIPGNRALRHSSWTVGQRSRSGPRLVAFTGKDWIEPPSAAPSAELAGASGIQFRTARHDFVSSLDLPPLSYSPPKCRPRNPGANAPSL